jgi:hypothetical protein
VKKSGTVKQSLYRHADVKGEKQYSSYSFLTSALDEGEWLATCVCRKAIETAVNFVKASIKNNLYTGILWWN